MCFSMKKRYLKQIYRLIMSTYVISFKRGRTKYQTLLKQAIRYAYTVPASDSVDVMLKKTTVDGGTTSDASGWKVISSAGDDVIFNSPAAMTTGTFYLYIDSRIGYTKPTMVYGTWYLDDNR